VEQVEYLRPNTEEVAFESVDGEVILINVTKGTYYSIDGVGGVAWELIEHGSTAEAICEHVLAHYDVAADVARPDLERFLAALVDEGLVVHRQGGENGAQAARAASAQRLAYVAPELNAFRDMADLLALDPPWPKLRELQEQPTDE